MLLHLFVRSFFIEKEMNYSGPIKNVLPLHILPFNSV